MKQSGHTLLELLIVVAIVLLLAAIVTPSTIRSYKHCKAWIWGVYAWNENRIEAFSNDKASEHSLLMYATNTPKKWNFIE